MGDILLITNGDILLYTPLEWGECVQYNPMFIVTEHYELLNVRV